MVEIELIAIKNSRDVSFFTWQEHDLIPLCVDISSDDDFDDAGLNDDNDVGLDDDDVDVDDDDDDTYGDVEEGERNNIDDGLIEVNLNVSCHENRTFDDYFDGAYICNVPDSSSAPHTVEENHGPLPHVCHDDHCNETSHV
ncbi:late secretory pathway protein AVL9-like [Humulus lupulus]|uniref:late secretory pathway protein AVL9-like n=1 Tax=Humulus lupulus TaxID=3486 RepID=UPI002B40308D|nr:late secretory pathway protein AVL9-like [Humulus lupulus]